MTRSKPAKLTSSATVLFVRDIHAATQHYRDAMGFSLEKIWGEPPSFAILNRDNKYVMLKQSTIINISFRAGPCPPGFGICISGSMTLMLSTKSS